MEELTQKVDAEVRVGATGPSRVTLGAIEATMSRVVDSDSPFVVAHPPSVPTLALLQDITYDKDSASWTLRYRTEQSDAADELNHYDRILYATKEGSAEVGDLHNPCLAQDVTAAACVTALKTSYVAADALVAGGGDSLSLTTGSVTPAITVDITTEENSSVQTLELNIPHAAIRNHLASEEVTQHPVLGDQTTWRFGIGMVFMGSHAEQSNIVLHDTFNLVEISNQLVTVSKSNSYSIAKHVSFYTQRVVDDPATADTDESEIYVAKVEVMLNDGHSLESIDTTINEVDVCSLAGKTTMQTAINNLNNSACITSHPLCEAVTFTSETGGVTRTWVSLVIPLVDVPVPGEVRISALLHSIDTGVSPPTRSVSSLNFATATPPQDACSPAAFETFNPIEHTTAELYRGVGVVAEPIDGYIAVHQAGEESVSTTDSLLTVVIKPKDATALAYMSQFPSERIMLDDVYISHALPEATMPADISNVIHTVSNGRARLLVDDALMQACPEEKAGFVYEDGQFTCVTTHDWGLDGALARPFSKQAPDGPEFLRYFVFDVSNNTEADAKLWLQENVVGQISSSAAAIADSIYTHATSRCVGDYAYKAKIYWMWPVYYWPDQSPVGLKDRAVLSLAWSLAKDPDYDPASAPSTPTTSVVAPVVAMSLGMPYTVAEFDSALQLQTREAIAATASVDVSLVEITSVTAVTTSRRLLSGGITVNVEIDVPATSDAYTLTSAITVEALNQQLTIKGVQSAQMLVAPALSSGSTPSTPSTPSTAVVVSAPTVNSYPHPLSAQSGYSTITRFANAGEDGLKHCALHPNEHYMPMDFTSPESDHPFDCQTREWYDAITNILTQYVDGDASKKSACEGLAQKYHDGTATKDEVEAVLTKHACPMYPGITTGAGADLMTPNDPDWEGAPAYKWATETYPDQWAAHGPAHIFSDTTYFFIAFNVTCFTTIVENMDTNEKSLATVVIWPLISSSNYGNGQVRISQTTNVNGNWGKQCMFGGTSLPNGNYKIHIMNPDSNSASNRRLLAYTPYTDRRDALPAIGGALPHVIGPTRLAPRPTVVRGRNARKPLSVQDTSTDAALERVAHRHGHGFTPLARARALNRLEAKSRRSLESVQEAFESLVSSHKTIMASMIPERPSPPPHLHRVQKRRPGPSVPM